MVSEAISWRQRRKAASITDRMSTSDYIINTKTSLKNLKICRFCEIIKVFILNIN